MLEQKFHFAERKAQVQLQMDSSEPMGQNLMLNPHITPSQNIWFNCECMHGSVLLLVYLLVQILLSLSQA